MFKENSTQNQSLTSSNFTCRNLKRDKETNGLEKVVTVAPEAEASLLERVDVGVNAYGAVGRGGFGEVAFGVQAVHEGDPFRPGVVDGG